MKAATQRTEAGPSSPRGARRDDELSRFQQRVERCEQLQARGLPFDELYELSRLYRVQSARLSRLRDRSADPDAIRHLNGLCVRAYAFLYSAGSASSPGQDAPSRELRRWDRWLPAAARQAWRAVALAWILLLGGALIGGTLASREPATLYALLPIGFGYTAERIDRLEASATARAEFLARDETSTGKNLLFGSQLFAHNTRVGILSFASGMLAGVPSVLLQLYNGMMLGAFSSLFLQPDSGDVPLHFAAWLLPHGVPELTAITLCCAAGLMLGASVAAPGRRRRSQALREDSMPALILVSCAIPLFMTAALTESFVRESALGTAPRLALAAAYTLVLALAHAWLWHRARESRVDTGWLSETLRGRRT